MTPPSLETRRLAIVAALRQVATPPARTTADVPAAPAAAASLTPPYPQDELATLRAEMHRLAERVERVEGKVDLIRDGDDAPLVWPVAVGGESTLEVPPVDVARRNSPAFDVLMGPPTSR